MCLDMYGPHVLQTYVTQQTRVQSKAQQQRLVYAIAACK